MTVDGSILASTDREDLGNGMELRLLSALEVLQARREAASLSEHDGERALCANACLLARALEEDGKPVFQDGREVLAGLTVAEIARLSRQWQDFDRRENPGLFLDEDGLEAVKKN
jgi:hypothetical protein